MGRTKRTRQQGRSYGMTRREFSRTATIALGLGALGGGGPWPFSPAPAWGQGSGGTMIYSDELADVPNLNASASLSSGGAGMNFAFNVFDGFVRRDLTVTEGEPPIAPGLATEWSYSADKLTWTFKLRPGVSFHDGTPWNADAAVYNFDSMYNDGSPHYNGLLSALSRFWTPAIDGWKKIDDLTVEITLKEPRPFAEEMSYIMMASPAAVEKLGHEEHAVNPVGTGPFKFKELVRGQKAEFEPNKEYWLGAPKLDRLIIRPIPNGLSRVAAVRTGEVLMATVIPADSVEELQDLGFSVLLKPYPHTWCFQFNMAEAPFNNKLVRQACNYAVDNVTLCKEILRGTADPAWQVATEGSIYYDTTLPRYEYNPDKARALLKEAGYENGIKSRWWIPTEGSGMMQPVQMSEFIQANLMDVGVEIELETFEWAAYLTEFFKGIRKGENIGAYSQSWGLFTSAWWGLHFSSRSIPPNGISNVGYYASETVDALFDKALRATDKEEETAIYKELQRVVLDDAPWLFVAHDKFSKAISPKVKGFNNTSSWFFSFHPVWVEA